MSAAAAEPELPRLPATPADRRALAAIDLGAESCRVSLLRWHADKPLIELVHRFSNAATHDGQGCLRWDLSRILQGLDEGLRRCAAVATEGIRSVAVDGWAVDYIRYDPHSRQRRGEPFCYRDARHAAAAESLHRELPAERLGELTGIQIQPLNTVYQFFADTSSERQWPWLNLPEYVLYALGAPAVAERTNASHTGMLGLDGRWSAEVLHKLGVPPAGMPPIVEPGTPLGPLRGTLTELEAFCATTLMAPACHDTASAIAAIPDSGDDWAYISSGTWSLVGTLLHASVNNSATRRENFTNLAGVDGTICFHKNVNGLWLLRQCMESWAAAGGVWEVGQLIAAAALARAYPFVLNVDDPELLQPGDMPARMNAQLVRRDLPRIDEAASAAPEVALLIFRSLAARYAEVLRLTSELTGRTFRHLYIMGGGSQNALLNRLTSEATGLEVRLAGTECSTVGNFAVQLAGLEHTGDSRPAAAWAALLASR